MPRLIAGLVCGSLLASGCGGSEAGACTEIRESADPQSFTHIVDVDSVTYRSDPPTSGPHLAVPVPEGVLDVVLVAPLQVRVLESGAALIQWEGVDDAVIDQLEDLAGPGVVVAPGANLPDPIVATAWTWKLTCPELDVAALTDFVRTRPASAPGQD